MGYLRDTLLKMDQSRQCFECESYKVRLDAFIEINELAGV